MRLSESMHKSSSGAPLSRSFTFSERYGADSTASATSSGSSGSVNSTGSLISAVSAVLRNASVSPFPHGADIKFLSLSVRLTPGAVDDERLTQAYFRHVSSLCRPAVLRNFFKVNVINRAYSVRNDERRIVRLLKAFCVNHAFV